jgi:Tfp pilus assembly protein PilV
MREHAPAPAERGDTLVELLIAIVILSMGVLGIFATLSGAIVASDSINGRANASQMLTRAADAIQRAPWECRAAPGEAYRGVLDALKPTERWTITVESIAHWAPSRTFETGCPSDDAPIAFQTLRLGVLIEVPGGRASQRVELVKRP